MYKHCHPIVCRFIKIQIGLTFLVPAYPGCPGKEAIKRVSVWWSLQESVKVDLVVGSVPRCTDDCGAWQLCRAGSSRQSFCWWSCVFTLPTCQPSRRTDAGVTSVVYLLIYVHIVFRPHRSTT